MVFKKIDRIQETSGCPLDDLYKTRFVISYKDGQITLLKNYHRHNNYFTEPTDTFITRYDLTFLPYITFITYREDNISHLEEDIIYKYIFEMEKPQPSFVDKQIIEEIVYTLKNLIRARKLNKLLTKNIVTVND